MTTLTHTHTPHLEAMSTVVDTYSSTQYTFCTECENNIERFYIDDDNDRLPFWGQWRVGN